MNKFNLETEMVKFKDYFRNDRYRYQAYLFLNRPCHFMGICYQIFITGLVIFCIIFTAICNDYTEKSSDKEIDDPKSTIDWNKWLLILDIAVTIIFSLEFIIQLWCSKCLPRYRGVKGFYRILWNPICLLDLFIILSTLVALCTGYKEIAIISDAFRGFRVLQFFEHKYRLWRLICAVIWNGRFQLLLCIYFAFILLISISLTLHLIEKQYNDDFHSLGRSIWFTLITLTTVGYGDTVPTSNYGRVITAVALVLGASVFSLPAGIIGAGLALKVEKEETIRSSLQENHAASVIQSAWRVYWSIRKFQQRLRTMSQTSNQSQSIKGFQSILIMNNSYNSNNLYHKRKLHQIIIVQFIYLLKFFMSTRRFKRSSNMLSMKNFHELYSQNCIEQMEKLTILERIVRDNESTIEEISTIIKQQQQQLSEYFNNKNRKTNKIFKKHPYNHKIKCKNCHRRWFKSKSTTSL